jgi:hypothetical protein
LSIEDTIKDTSRWQHCGGYDYCSLTKLRFV